VVTCGHGPREYVDAGIADVTERIGGLVGLVDDADPVAVDSHRALQEVVDAERDDHDPQVSPPTLAEGWPERPGDCALPRSWLALPNYWRRARRPERKARSPWVSARHSCSASSRASPS